MVMQYNYLSVLTEEELATTARKTMRDKKMDTYLTMVSNCKAKKAGVKPKVRPEREMKIPAFSKGQKHHKAAIVALSPACRPPPTIAQRKQILQIDGLFRENSQLPKHVVSSTVLTEAMRIFRICFRIPLQADDARGFRYLIDEVNKGGSSLASSPFSEGKQPTRKTRSAS